MSAPVPPNPELIQGILRGRVTILHVRDPDSSCAMTVYLDGVPVEADEIDIDAGRGYDADDWAENIEWHRANLPEGQLRDDVLDALGDPPGSKYIDGWSERSAT